jgi:hypothetical protein
MKKWAAIVAVMFVRSWTRAYTAGMPAQARRRRRAEVECDIWESLHDGDNTHRHATHILVRLVRGMRADVLWRLEHLLQGGEIMWRKYALIGFAAAAVTTIAWSLAIRASDVSLPALPGAPTPIYIVKHRTPPPPPPPPPTWEEFVAKVNGKPLER